MSDTISKQTARRYILGKHGLWPGRRHVGKEGTEAALRASECVQIDPINAAGRSHDLTLLSRVEGYRSEHLVELMYQDRCFFEFGGILLIYPFAELPFLQTVMRRIATRHRQAADKYKEPIEVVLATLTDRGPLAGRDFEGRVRIPGGFRTVKDTGAALHYLSMTGRIMTHSRRNNDRVYDLFERIAGAEFGATRITDDEAEEYIGLKALRDLGIATPSEWARRVRIMLHRLVPPAEARGRLTAMVQDGSATKVTVEGRKEQSYVPAEDLPLLEEIERGEVPAAWQATVTLDETVNLLAPLDNIIWDRARTLALFDFDYVWEVYKPEALRRWGYYTLPLLWGDRLVGRLYPHVDRKAGAIQVRGLWLEDKATATDPAFAPALAAGLRRLAAFNNVERYDLTAIPPARLRQKLARLL